MSKIYNINFLIENDPPFWNFSENSSVLLGPLVPHFIIIIVTIATSRGQLGWQNQRNKRAISRAGDWRILHYLKIKKYSPTNMFTFVITLRSSKAPHHGQRSLHIMSFLGHPPHSHDGPNNGHLRPYLAMSIPWGVFHYW